MLLIESLAVLFATASMAWLAVFVLAFVRAGNAGKRQMFADFAWMAVPLACGLATLASVAARSDQTRVARPSSNMHELASTSVALHRDECIRDSAVARLEVRGESQTTRRGPALELNQGAGSALRR